jgi:hypothetical protein
MALCLLTLQWVGCDSEGSSDGPPGAPRRSLTRSLTESMRFDGATRVETLLPEPTSTMWLESLSEDVLVVPGQQGMLSLQLVDMTDQQAVATLMEVTVPGEEVREGQGSHIVVPVAEDQTGSLIHNPFEVDEDLCRDACNAVFQVTVLQAVELEGGEVSEPVETTLIVDCGRDGFPGSCSADDPVVDVCGDAREAQLVYTRERPWTCTSPRRGGSRARPGRRTTPCWRCGRASPASWAPMTTTWRAWWTRSRCASPTAPPAACSCCSVSRGAGCPPPP